MDSRLRNLKNVYKQTTIKSSIHLIIKVEYLASLTRSLSSTLYNLLDIYSSYLIFSNASNITKAHKKFAKPIILREKKYKQTSIKLCFYVPNGIELEIVKNWIIS